MQPFQECASGWCLPAVSAPCTSFHKLQSVFGAGDDEEAAVKAGLEYVKAAAETAAHATAAAIQAQEGGEAEAAQQDPVTGLDAEAELAELLNEDPEAASRPWDEEEEGSEALPDGSIVRPGTQYRILGEQLADTLDVLADESAWAGLEGDTESAEASESAMVDEPAADGPMMGADEAAFQRLMAEEGYTEEQVVAAEELLSRVEDEAQAEALQDLWQAELEAHAEEMGLGDDEVADDLLYRPMRDEIHLKQVDDLLQVVLGEAAPSRNTVGKASEDGAQIWHAPADLLATSYHMSAAISHASESSQLYCCCLPLQACNALHATSRCRGCRF